ncbi:unnamed protein product (macronuclear) [Paramecium tetraurelia]|uniref:Uncharacterized protein n=1 Tax=Paramecium tetraurelia TaxID=5888 RepID=A0D270_PARTE|nr:uncharacterized protein GSPATT00012643001 [Paramecium tetraurelia]CAK77137.1 unnamed protein product [Paramecium tetraurelia]|eukprot:XP_001444534.1 hypothetical protein (macronuclear) [Paramecium tetraurelia strain d4-2]
MKYDYKFLKNESQEQLLPYIQTNTKTTQLDHKEIKQKIKMQVNLKKYPTPRSLSQRVYYWTKDETSIPVIQKNNDSSSIIEHSSEYFMRQGDWKEDIHSPIKTTVDLSSSKQSPPKFSNIKIPKLQIAKKKEKIEYYGDVVTNRSNSSSQKLDLKADYFYNIINPLKKETKPDRNVKQECFNQAFHILEEIIPASIIAKQNHGLVQQSLSESEIKLEKKKNNASLAKRQKARPCISDQPQPNSHPEPLAHIQTQILTLSKTETQPQPQPRTQPQTQPLPLSDQPQPQSLPQPRLQPITQPQPQPQPQPQTQAQPQNQPQNYKKGQRLKTCVMSYVRRLKRCKLTHAQVIRDHVFSAHPYSKDHSIEFFQAIKDNQEPIVTRLLQKVPYLVYDFDNAHMTGLHWAAKRGFPNLVKILIQHNADVDAKDIVYRTPLYIATDYAHGKASAKYIEIIQILLYNQAYPWSYDHIQYSSVIRDDKKVKELFAVSRKIHLIILITSPQLKDQIWNKEVPAMNAIKNVSTQEEKQSSNTNEILKGNPHMDPRLRQFYTQKLVHLKRKIGNQAYQEIEKQIQNEQGIFEYVRKQPFQAS